MSTMITIIAIFCLTSEVLVASDPVCPYGIQQVSCDYSDPCAEATCEVAAEECISSTCGGCYHYFLDRNENRLSGMKCDCSAQSPCLVNPCEGAECGAESQAIAGNAQCVEYCNCKRKWYLESPPGFPGETFEVTDLCETVVED